MKALKQYQEFRLQLFCIYYVSKRGDKYRNKQSHDFAWCLRLWLSDEIQFQGLSERSFYSKQRDASCCYSSYILQLSCFPPKNAKNCFWRLCGNVTVLCRSMMQQAESLPGPTSAMWSCWCPLPCARMGSTGPHQLRCAWPLTLPQAIYQNGLDLE